MIFFLSSLRPDSRFSGAAGLVSLDATEDGVTTLLGGDSFLGLVSGFVWTGLGDDSLLLLSDDSWDDSRDDSRDESDNEERSSSATFLRGTAEADSLLLA